MEFHRLHFDVHWRVRYISPEDRIVFGLIADLKIVRTRCFSRIRFDVSPKSVVYGKIASDVNSKNRVVYSFCFKSIIWGKYST